MEIEEFRNLTKEIIRSEKDGFWSDWTDEQKHQYEYGTWKDFSKSRGYSESEISNFQLWVDEIQKQAKLGVNILASVTDLTYKALIDSMEKDKRGELYLSAHLPKTYRGRRAI